MQREISVDNFLIIGACLTGDQRGETTIADLLQRYSLEVDQRRNTAHVRSMLLQ